ncbi:phosphoglycerate mutase family protein [Ancylostoma ceylanicum]|uniref:Phosphoglycerate mutase family protein n=1 Tax=Ancylostoma ceylanicum TaxID=53326 RepID=A0A0D6L861_9BILA|nr:phosphoglycerate mutase family protein [Ancylostoma ceylanicum]
MKHPSRILWFVRHGERVDNLNKAWKLTAERWDDPPLSPRGHQQAREVGVALAAEPIDYAICSPFTRCIETVTEIFSVRKVSPPIWIEPGLGESLNVCMTPPGRPTMEQIKKINPNVDDSYEPVYSVLPPEFGGDAGCIPRVIKTLKTILTKYPTGKVITDANAMKCEYFGDKRHLSDQTNLHEVQSKTRACTQQQIDEIMKQIKEL